MGGGESRADRSRGIEAAQVGCDRIGSAAQRRSWKAGDCARVARRNDDDTGLDRGTGEDGYQEAPGASALLGASERMKAHDTIDRPLYDTIDRPLYFTLFNFKNR